MKEGIIPPCEAIIPCGGKGTRVNGAIKSLLQVDGRELLRYSFDNLPAKMVKTLMIATRSQGDLVYQWVLSQDLPYQQVLFSCSGDISLIERITRAAIQLNGDHLVICNSDEVRSGLDFQRVIEFHQQTGGLATLVVGLGDHLHEQRLVTAEEHGRILQTEKNPVTFINRPEERGLVNTGLIVMNRRALEYVERLPEGGWSCILDPLADAGQLYAFIDPQIAYFNINTIEQLRRASDFCFSNRCY